MTVVSLSVHKNNREQRRLKALRREARGRVENALRQIDDIDGYVILTIGKSGATVCSYRLPDGMSKNLLPDYVKRDIERTIHLDDAKPR